MYCGAIHCEVPSFAGEFTVRWAMREIWIPEFLASAFTLIFLIRPLCKGLWPLDGIAWFPLLSLTIMAALFPAYGFRPEAIPLLIYQGVMALKSRPLLAGGRRGLYKRSFLFTFPALGLLALFTALALCFAPLVLPPAEIRLIRGPRDYTLWIFDARPPSRGSIFLVPPEYGGMRAVDGVCGALAARGFTVIGYSRPGLRSPAELARLWSSFREGTVLKKANERGRALEEEKRREIESILPYVRENLGTLAPDAEKEALFLAGWGPGGAALHYLAAEQGSRAGRRSGPLASRPGTGAGRMLDGVRGLVAVESRLWSLWEPELPPATEGAPAGNPLERGLEAAGRWFARFRPEKIRGPGEAEPPAMPLLYLVSDRAFAGERDYDALFAALGKAQHPAALAALEGAGPLDYGDFPAEYPLYSALFPGGAAGRFGGLFTRNPAEDTAAIIARFCGLVAGNGTGGRAAEGEAGVNAGTAAGEPGRRPPRRALRLETRYWNLGDLRLY
jgi:hypothetical protein